MCGLVRNSSSLTRDPARPLHLGRAADYYRDETNSTDTEMEVPLHNRPTVRHHRDYGRNVIIETVRRTCRSND